MENQLLKISEVCKITGLARSTIYLQIQNEQFPKPVKIGKRSVAWRGSDLSTWMSNLSTQWPSE